jgi:crotonobetainyl-CoA:carnitine CoA-transferase CaiB-like acyl-CoA transferase
MLPRLRECFSHSSAAELARRFEANGLPYAPITRPQDLFDDPHLRATGGLAGATLPDGQTTRMPLLPVTMGGERLPLRLNPPRLGEHTEALLAEAGYGSDEIQALRESGVIGTDARATG